MEISKVLKSNSYLIGKWRGLGELLIKPISRRMGKLPIEIKINKGGKISGRIGEANLMNVVLKVVSFGYELHAELDNYVKKNYQIDKDRFCILFISPENKSEETKEIHTNFQLKSNFFFDSATLIGGVDLRKQLKV